MTNMDAVGAVEELYEPGQPEQPVDPAEPAGADDAEQQAPNPDAPPPVEAVSGARALVEIGKRSRDTMRQLSDSEWQAAKEVSVKLSQKRLEAEDLVESLTNNLKRAKTGLNGIVDEWTEATKEASSGHGIREVDTTIWVDLDAEKVIEIRNDTRQEVYSAPATKEQMDKARQTTLVFEGGGHDDGDDEATEGYDDGGVQPIEDSDGDGGDDAPAPITKTL